MERISEDGEVELLPCPNCGNNNQNEIQLHYWLRRKSWKNLECFEFYNVSCNLCGFKSSTKNTEGEAINDWQLNRTR